MRHKPSQEITKEAALRAIVKDLFEQVKALTRRIDEHKYDIERIEKLEARNADTDAKRRLLDLERRVNELEARPGITIHYPQYYAPTPDEFLKLSPYPSYPQHPSTDPTQWPNGTILCGTSDWAAPGK